MGRKFAVAVGLLVVAAILGASVLREPIAAAASPFTNVIVGNDASNPVPVREQNTDANGNIRVHESSATALVATAQVSSGHSVDIDVSQYREIRFASSGFGCSGGTTAFFTVDAIEEGVHYRVMALQLCGGASGANDDFFEDLAANVIEVPGRTLRLQAGTGGSVNLAIFGRTN